MDTIALSDEQKQVVLKNIQDHKLDFEQICDAMKDWWFYTQRTQLIVESFVENKASFIFLDGQTRTTHNGQIRVEYNYMYISGISRPYADRIERFIRVMLLTGE